MSRQKDHARETVGAISLLLLVFALYMFVCAYAYFDELRYLPDGFLTYTGVCEGYKMVRHGKNDRMLQLYLDGRKFVTTRDDCLNKDFFDEVKQGDSLTVTYAPVLPVALFRANESLMSIEKDGKAYLDTAACIDTLRMNGWISVGLAVTASILGIGGIVSQRKTCKK